MSRRLGRPALAKRFAIPQERPIDPPLIAGAAIFGLGWGMAGLCPGPAIAGLVLSLTPILVFVATMLVGMAAHDFWRGGTVGGAAELPLP